jgi:hypothetical protein
MKNGLILISNLKNIYFIHEPNNNDDYDWNM